MDVLRKSKNVYKKNTQVKYIDMNNLLIAVPLHTSLGKDRSSNKKTERSHREVFPEFSLPSYGSGDINMDETGASWDAKGRTEWPFPILKTSQFRPNHYRGRANDN